MTDSERKPELDELYGDVCKFAESNKIVTPSLLQRNFRVGYSRAILLIEQIEAAGLIERIEQEKFNSFKWQWKAMTKPADSDQKPEFIPKCTGYDVRILFHTPEAETATSDTGKVQNLVGAALDALGIEEEIDYTLEVNRHYL